jgi:hypothetical protein
MAQGRLGVDRVAVDADLEVEVAADGAGVPGLADGADALAGVEALAAMDQGGAGQVRVEVAAVLAFAVNQEVVAVEHRVVASSQDPAVAHGDQRCAAGGDDVKAFVSATAAARCAEFPDVATGSVRSLNREDVTVVLSAAVVEDDPSRCWGGKRRGEEKDYEGETGQWCSMTRSTMLYSFASSALMK